MAGIFIDGARRFHGETGGSHGNGEGGRDSGASAGRYKADRWRAGRACGCCGGCGCCRWRRLIGVRIGGNERQVGSVGQPKALTHLDTAGVGNRAEAGVAFRFGVGRFNNCTIGVGLAVETPTNF